MAPDSHNEKWRVWFVSAGGVVVASLLSLMSGELEGKGSTVIFWSEMAFGLCCFDSCSLCTSEDFEGIGEASDSADAAWGRGSKLDG